MYDIRKKKLLYIMGIDWDWIYQRPQIIEQHLEEDYEVTVIYPRSILDVFRRKRAAVAKPARTRILWTLPRQERYQCIGKIARFLFGGIFRDVNDFDVVILGYPLFYRYIPEDYQGRVIYDCMDYHAALYPDSQSVNKLLRQEELLLRKSDAIVVTAQKLYTDVVKKGIKKQKLYLIRNGTFMTGATAIAYRNEQKELYKIGYFGTIAEWFDYELLIDSARRHKNLEYHLIGPEKKKCPEQNSHIIMEGTVKNSDLAEYTQDYDCLIMPFVVNDIVQWVDPVKLYEYIALGKCIICVRYEEIERFEPYVYMYRDADEYEKLLENLIKQGFPPKYTGEQQQRFLEENSWNQRFKAWDSVLENVIRG